MSSNTRTAAADAHAAPDADVRWMTEAETADYLRLTMGGLRWFRRNGTGPRYAKFGRFIRYTQQDVDAWASAQTVDVN